MAPYKGLLMATSMFVLMCAAFAKPGASQDPEDVDVSQRDEIDCELDDDQMNSDLERCLRIGKEFIHDYVKSLKRGKQYQNKCSEYKKLRNCLVPMMDNCTAIKHNYHRHWSVVIENMDYECLEHTQESEANFQCIETEMKSMMGGICDSFYKFNDQQKSKATSCHLLHEHIWCRQNLVVTACGEKAGLFVFHLMKLFYDKKLRKEQCQLKRNHGFKLFGYSDECPRDFVSEIKQCSDTYLTMDTVLTFTEQNVVIADAGRKQVNHSCKAYREFKRCVRPIRQRCPHGTKLIYEYEGDFRVYLTKMDYICQDGIEENYSKNLKCYKTALREDDVVSYCNRQWLEVKPYVTNITSYNYFCEANNPLTVGLSQQLENLQLCYFRVFNTSCGITAAEMVAELIRKALSDPFYLRLDYKPDCELHNPPPSTLPPTTTTTTTTTTTMATTKHVSVAKETEGSEGKGSQSEANEVGSQPTRPRGHTDRPRYGEHTSGGSKLSLSCSVWCVLLSLVLTRTLLVDRIFCIR